MLLTLANDWVVYAKRPFGGPEQVLKYLANYTHRVAISNHRLLPMQGDRVRFRWRDYAHGNRKRVMAIDAVEFIRRFLMHTLPSGFVRIRHSGFLANACRREKLARCRGLLGGDHPVIVEPEDVNPQETRIPCPKCEHGYLIRFEFDPTSERQVTRDRYPALIDSS